VLPVPCREWPMQGPAVVIPWKFSLSAISLVAVTLRSFSAHRPSCANHEPGPELTPGISLCEWAPRIRFICGYFQAVFQSVSPSGRRCRARCGLQGQSYRDVHP
jgi:hypothetical protein